MNSHGRNSPGYKVLLATASLLLGSCATDSSSLPPEQTLSEIKSETDNVTIVSSYEGYTKNIKLIDHDQGRVSFYRGFVDLVEYDLESCLENEKFHCATLDYEGYKVGLPKDEALDEWIYDGLQYTRAWTSGSGCNRLSMIIAEDDARPVRAILHHGSEGIVTYFELSGPQNFTDFGRKSTNEYISEVWSFSGYAMWKLDRC